VYVYFLCFYYASYDIAVVVGAVVSSAAAAAVSIIAHAIVRRCTGVWSVASATLCVCTLEGKLLELSTPLGTHSAWQELGMHWPCNQKVKVTWLSNALLAWACRSIWLCRFLVTYDIDGPDGAVRNMCVCVQTLACELTDLWPRYFTCRFTLTFSHLDSKVALAGQCLWSWAEKFCFAKVVFFTHFVARQSVLSMPPKDWWHMYRCLYW